MQLWLHSDNLLQDKQQFQPPAPFFICFPHVCQFHFYMIKCPTTWHFWRWGSCKARLGILLPHKASWVTRLTPMGSIQPFSDRVLLGSCHLHPVPAVSLGPESPTSSFTVGEGDGQYCLSSSSTLSVTFSLLSYDCHLGDNHQQTSCSRAQAKGVCLSHFNPLELALMPMLNKTKVSGLQRRQNVATLLQCYQTK